MTNQQLWKKMDILANEGKSVEQRAAFMELLKTAYDEDLGLIISCKYLHDEQQLARQNYLDLSGNRFMICYTSQAHAEREKRGGTWDIAKARDILNNMFNKDAIAGQVFNPSDEKMVIILKPLLWMMMPGAKPKPLFFSETKSF